MNKQTKPFSPRHLFGKKEKTKLSFSFCIYLCITMYTFIWILVFIQHSAAIEDGDLVKEINNQIKDSYYETGETTETKDLLVPLSSQGKDGDTHQTDFGITIPPLPNKNVEKEYEQKSLISPPNNNVNMTEETIHNDTSSTVEESSSYLTMYGDHRAPQALASLPGWLQNYTEWNKKATSNRQTTQYMVLMCLPDDNSCGGLSDRFRGLLFYLLIAKITNRVLCFYWTRPAPLETFLQPTEVGIDWRCPADLSLLVDEKVTTRRQEKIRVYYFGDCDKTPRHPVALEPMPCIIRELEDIRSSNDTYVASKMFGNTVAHVNNLNDFAQRHSYVDMMPVISQWQYPNMIEHIFRAFFKPVKPLAQQINRTMTQLKLVENEYASVHVRARYPAGKIRENKKRKEVRALDQGGKLPFEGNHKKLIVEIMDNAIKCGNLLAPDLPMYFASDHHNATKHVISNEYIGKDGKPFQPIGLDMDKMPVHIGIRDFQQFDPTDFYSVFEDLLIMGGSKCVTHGIGSFGTFGAGLAGNRCRSIHRIHNGKPIDCPNGRGEPQKIAILDSQKIIKEEPGGGWEGKLNCNISKILT